MDDSREDSILGPSPEEIVSTADVPPLSNRENSEVPTAYTSPDILGSRSLLNSVLQKEGKLPHEVSARLLDRPDTTGLEIVLASTGSESDGRLSRDELEMMFLVCICHICIGFSMGAISPAMEPVTEDFRLSATWRGVLGAAALAGNIVGSPMGGAIADFWGRRACMMSAWSVFILSCGLQGVALNKEQLCGARVLLGWSVGAHYTGTTTFLSETLNPALVGSLLSLVEANFFIGNFFALAAGATIRSLIRSDSLRWRLTLSVCAVPVLFGLVWFYFRARETNSWIRARRMREAVVQTEDASTGERDIAAFSPALQSERTPQIVPSVRELDDLDFESRESQTMHEEMSTASSLIFVSIFWGTLIVPTYAVSAFAVSILTDLNAAIDPFHLNIYLGAAAAAGVFIGMALVDRWGRKQLLLLSQWGVAMAFVVLGGVKPLLAAAGNAAIAAPTLIGLLVAFELLNGAGAPLALVYPAEIFPSRIKGIASGVSAMNSRIMAVLSILIMSYTLTSFGTGVTLAGLGFMSGLGAVVTHLMAPNRKTTTVA